MKVIKTFLVIGLFGYLTWYVYQENSAFKSQFGQLQNQLATFEDRIKKLENNANKPIPPKEIVQREIIKEKSQEELLTSAVAKVATSVVSIVVSKDVPKLEVVYQNPFGNDPFFKDFNFKIPTYQQKGTEKQKVGAGTGFLNSSDGYILTNKHVVFDENAQYMVLMSSGDQKSADVVYRDEKNDIAIIKIEGSGYPKVTFGDSSGLKLGQTVAAIGNALGEYNNSVSVGIISGLNRKVSASDGRRVEQLSGVIQTDAAINPGNSGGPLFDLYGRVIGINVATVIGSSNISFSIPINLAKPIVREVVGKI